LKTSVAAGITGEITTRSGKALASGHENDTGMIRLRVRTNRLASNRSVRLRAVVLVQGQEACSKQFRLKVDNRRPRLLHLSTSRGGGDVLALSISEKGWVTMYGRGVPRRWRHPRILSAHRLHHLRLPGSVHTARMIVRDRAGNKLVKVVRWG
jgi:hypothetical protein